MPETTAPTNALHEAMLDEFRAGTHDAWYRLARAASRYRRSRSRRRGVRRARFTLLVAEAGAFYRATRDWLALGFTLADLADPDDCPCCAGLLNAAYRYFALGKDATDDEIDDLVECLRRAAEGECD